MESHFGDAAACIFCSYGMPNRALIPTVCAASFVSDRSSLHILNTVLLYV